VLACGAVLGLTGCTGPVTAGAGSHPGRPRHTAVQQPSGPRTAGAGPGAVRSSAARYRVAYLRTRLHLADLTVDSAVMNTSGTVTPAPPQPDTGPLTGLPSFCDVAITQTDPAGNPIHTDVWLPESWNRRFQGVGGAVYSCGPYYYEMAPAIQAGYAAATTDCGVPLTDLDTARWALKDRRLDWPLIHDFTYAGIHDMAVAGKKGKAPGTIPGSVTNPITNVVTRRQPLCRYPLFARYRGHGRRTVASSYTCKA
jgi:hypothetical protein